MIRKIIYKTTTLADDKAKMTIFFYDNIKVVKIIKLVLSKNDKIIDYGFELLKQYKEYCLYRQVMTIKYDTFELINTLFHDVEMKHECKSFNRIAKM